MNLNRILAYSLCSVALLAQLSCQQDNKTPALFELMENTGINFKNDVQHNKDVNVLTFRNFYNGGGVAIGDINNDGLADVFFTANMGPNKLYLNKGNWQFEDISEKAGFTDKDRWSTGAVMVDINHDGWLDIFVANSGNMTDSLLRRNQLFINNKDLTFTESAADYGLDDDGYTTQATFFDYDLDGDLDCFLVNNSPIPVNTLNYANKRSLPASEWPVAGFLKGGGDHLFRNDDGKFVEVTKEAGIHGSLISLGLGATVGDVNGDGYPDIYVSNDFFEKDYLYINQRNGTFRDELEQRMQHISLASMGADMADINNDGHPEIFTTDMLPDDDYRLKTTSSFDNIDQFRLRENSDFYYQYMQNTLQLNKGDGTFNDVAWYSGVAASDWSWGPLMFDADNDGLVDLFVCNGIYLDVTDQDFIDFFANEIIQRMVMTGKKEEVEEILNKMPSHPILNKAYRNIDGLKFQESAKEWGLVQTSFSNGAAYGDLDNDGDLDLIISNVNQPAFVYRNNCPPGKNHYLSIFLKGKGKNTFAIGSKIQLFSGDRTWCREVVPSRGFQSSVDYKTTIGLGSTTTIDSMIIYWPDRSVSRIKNPAVDSLYTIEQPGNAEEYLPTPAEITPLFAAIAHNFEKHRENNHIDFYYERNIPFMLSREGPAAAVADVNGDGLEDVYIGGAAGQPGQLYIQTEKGFVKKEQDIFNRYAEFEDVAVLFFDADNDGDADLFIGAGGNHVSENAFQLRHRLYKNDGKGNFSLDASAFNDNNGVNISVAVAHDFDGDGDLDLFVGGRSVPMNYGPAATSYVYLNDGNGHFTDIAKNSGNALASPGMVTDAIWADVTGGPEKELIIVGEWMSPRIFSWNGNRFEEVKTDLSNYSGFWQSVAAVDVDGDNDLDLVIGNMGENAYLRASDQQPLKIWISDFDQNGSIDKIITRTINGKDMPVFLKREMTDQLPGLKKRSLKHREFADKTFQDLFPDYDASKITTRQVNFMSSIIAVNEGGGKFSIRPLPAAVQLTCANTILCRDFNKDQKVDILIGGNNFGFLPQFGRLDAGGLNLLINDGKGGFTAESPLKSGLDVRGVVRDIAVIQGKDEIQLLVLQNDNAPALFKYALAPAEAVALSNKK